MCALLGSYIKYYLIIIYKSHVDAAICIIVFTYGYIYIYLYIHT